MSTYIEQLVEEQLRNEGKLSITKLMSKMLDKQMEYIKGTKERSILSKQLDVLESIFKQMWRELHIENKEASFILEGIWVESKGLPSLEGFFEFDGLQQPEITVGVWYYSREVCIDETFERTYKVDGVVVRNSSYDVCIIENNDVENIINYNKEVEEPLERALKNVEIKLIMD